MINNRFFKFNFLFFLKYIIIFICGFYYQSLCSQTNTVSIICVDKEKNPIADVNIQINNNKEVNFSNESGFVSLELNIKDEIMFKRIGFYPKKIIYNGGNFIKVTLRTKEESLAEIVVLGSRSQAKSNAVSVAAVDLFDLKSLAKIYPYTSVNDLLNNLVPSFTATPQTVNGGTDFIDPASIRGLGTDQTLVLINGKRRYTTSLVNVNGSVGRGSISTDLNSIAPNSIDKIEILRDGAAAQYGSDAVAGVINITLKRDFNKGNASISYGTNISSFQSYSQRTSGDFNAAIYPQYVERNIIDGQKFNAQVNYGWTFGKKGSFIDVAFNYEQREPTIRSGERTGFLDNRNLTDSASNALLQNLGLKRSDFSFRVGQARLQNIQVVINGEIMLNPLKKKILYYNSIFSFRQGNSSGFYRLPYQSENIPEIYPKGFLPFLNSRINDHSVTIGYKGLNNSGWNYDISNVFGGNTFNIIVTNSVNVSAYYYDPNSAVAKQTTFNTLTFGFYQNTTNADFSKNIKDALNTNLAFGLESRIENYQQIAGDEASWANYSRFTNGVLDIYNGTPRTYRLANGTIGFPVPGSQVFTGLDPQNANNVFRYSQAGYFDFEINPFKNWVINGAIRLENYSDFGTNVSYKLAQRVTVIDGLFFRSTFNTGFRAPSLQQKFLAKTSSIILGGVVNLEATLPNDSRAAQLLGIPNLKPEISYSFTAGVTYNEKNFNLTADYYNTIIIDRIILTDAFYGSNSASASIQDKTIYDALLANNATRAVFMANALDLQVVGFDLSLGYKWVIDNKNYIRFEFAGTISNRSQIGSVKASDLLKGKEYIYLSPYNKNFIFDALPQSKGYVSFDYHWKNFNIFTKIGYIGSVTHIEPYTVPTLTANLFGAEGWFYKQILEPKNLLDITIGYDLSNMFRLNLGAYNVLDIYPDLIDATKGTFFQVDTKSGSTTYNTIIREYNAHLTGISNNDAVTSNNQFNYSRRVSQLNLNGRYLFVKLDVRF